MINFHGLKLPLSQVPKVLEPLKFYCLLLSEYLQDIQDYNKGSGDFGFPIIADPKRELATQLGMLDPDEKTKEGLPLTCRAVSIPCHTSSLDIPY